MKPNLEMHIEELVLHGFPPSNYDRIGEAVERELACLFAEQGAPPSLVQGSEIQRLDGGSFEVKPGSGVEAVGAQVAQAVYGGLAR